LSKKKALEAEFQEAFPPQPPVGWLSRRSWIHWMT